MTLRKVMNHTVRLRQSAPCCFPWEWLSRVISLYGTLYDVQYGYSREMVNDDDILLFIQTTVRTITLWTMMTILWTMTNTGCTMTITNNTIFSPIFGYCGCCGLSLSRLWMWNYDVVLAIENAELASSCRGDRSPSAVFPWGDEILVVPIGIQECKLIVPVDLVVGSRRRHGRGLFLWASGNNSRPIIKDTCKCRPVHDPDDQSAVEIVRGYEFLVPAQFLLLLRCDNNAVALVCRSSSTNGRLFGQRCRRTLLPTR